jgi:hypothetical protein
MAFSIFSTPSVAISSLWPFGSGATGTKTAMTTETKVNPDQTKRDTATGPTWTSYLNPLDLWGQPTAGPKTPQSAIPASNEPAVRSEAPPRSSAATLNPQTATVTEKPTSTKPDTATSGEAGTLLTEKTVGWKWVPYCSSTILTADEGMLGTRSHLAKPLNDAIAAYTKEPTQFAKFNTAMQDDQFSQLTEREKEAIYGQVTQGRLSYFQPNDWEVRKPRVSSRA